jgi:hypothetical protein
MNNQIEKLAEQAGFMDSWFSESGDDCEQELKKFGELLIKKCVQVIQDEACYTGNAKVAGLDIAKEAIQKYFGVEQ